MARTSEPDRRNRRAELLRAGGHPVRLEILELLAGKGDMSPVALSEWMTAKVGVISYHARALADGGLIRLATTELRRGAVEHIYAIEPDGQALLKAAKRL